MPHRITGWLNDIFIRIERIEHILGEERNFFGFQNNIAVHDAVERNLEIIGEAMKRILDKDPTIAISHARAIVGLRNRVIHTYDKVDDEEIWKIVCNDLPKLKTEVEGLLNNM